MEEDKDYIIKAKFVVFMEVFNIYGIALPQIMGICDTKEIAEAVEKDLKEDNEFKNKRIFIAPIISGEKIPKTKQTMSKIRNWIQDKFSQKRTNNGRSDS